MKHQQSLGLVVEGNATASVILRFPSILDELGPIKAGVPRVARRLSNFLRAGYPVATYDELQETRVILLRVPDEAISRVVDELCASNLELSGLQFVLIESCVSTSVLAPLAKLGAGIASLMALPTPRKSWFVAEGHLGAIRYVRRLLSRHDARVFELKPGTKALYFAAHLLAAELPVQLMTSAQQALRTAGIKGNHLHELLAEMSFEMFRSFANGARFHWPETRSGCPPETVDEYLQRLRAEHPQIASALEEQLTFAARRATDAKTA